MKFLDIAMLLNFLMSIANADIINHDQIANYRLTETIRGECSTKITVTRNDLVVQIVYLEHEYGTGRTETQELQNFANLDLGDDVYLKSALDISEKQLFYSSVLYKNTDGRETALEMNRVIISKDGNKESIYLEVRDGNGNIEKACVYQNS